MVRRLGLALAAATWLVAVGLPGFGFGGAADIAITGLGMGGIRLPAFGPSPVAAATPDLTLVTDARYVVQPEKARVHIVVDVVATNHKSDTVTRRFFFENAYLAVLPGTSGFAATAQGASPTVRVKSTTIDYTLLEITFGKRVYAGDSTRLRLAFDLRDPGGNPTRDVRVGTSLVTFPVWAFATNSTAGSTVTVVFPAGYVPQVESGTLPAPTTASNGQIVFRSGPLDQPLDFSAYLVADRPASYAVSNVTASVGDKQVDVVLRAFPDDRDWAKRTGQLFAQALSTLSSAIGLPLRDDTLTVEETASRTIGGYAGLFDPNLATVKVSYSADPFVALHEAAHAWFNGRLLADRWANEAFASYYGKIAADELGVATKGEPLTPALTASRVPLNAWGALGKTDRATEDYAYAASYQLANLIAGRAGSAGLQAIWSAIAAGERAYQPAHAAPGVVERDRVVPDWRGLLDQLEQHTGRRFDDLWRTWVVTTEQAALLDERTTARAAYAQAVTAAADWELPEVIRQAMTAWQFSSAETLIATARSVVDARPALQAEAASDGLRLPIALRQAFEGALGPDAAVGELAAEQRTMRDIEVAIAAEVTPRDTLGSVGLWGSSPDTLLGQAKDAFAAGDLRGARDAANAATDEWTQAHRVGRGRIISILAAVASASFLVSALAGLRRRRPPHAHRLAHAVAVPPGTYATLPVDPAATASTPAEPTLRPGDTGEPPP